MEIDGDGAVFACCFGGLSHVSSPCRWLSVKMRHRDGNALKDQAYGERIGASPLNPMECEIFLKEKRKRRRPVVVVLRVLGILKVLRARNDFYNNKLD